MTSPMQASTAVTATSPVAGLADAIDSILDKGLVIDAFVRVSVIGIDLLTVEARIVISSVDTYLQFAEAVSRLTGPALDPSAPLLDGHRTARHLTEGPVGATALRAVGGSPGGGGATGAPAPG